MGQYFKDRSITSLPVKIVFLRMDCEPSQYIDLPQEYKLEHYKIVPLSLYRYVYNHVGQSYCWWMRKIISDAQLAKYFDNSLIEVYFLKNVEDNVIGFCELDCRIGSSINISYFGLMPRWIGKRIGRSFFSQVLKVAWAKNPENVRINTCELDHPKALPLYLESGFKRIANEVELWHIPQYLNLPVPDAIKL
ncbi:hypothetical protein COMNV_00222 [Commensalibacter sp. Nvir]|uniref:GNAT family N-acetyltransferase n=1 Tax=Commensalibacter sp. Nvir TaxID=3069817 RepID=UPI002D64008D|nr:hypothetical protein COMNV_00222 [Commensalibacter sp. Nvir]